MTAADIMQSKVICASPSWTLPDLERAFLEHRVNGFPVVHNGTLLGVVSRSDLVRKLALERSRAGQVSDYFLDSRSVGEEEDHDLESAETAFVSERMAHLRVDDVMSPVAFVVASDTPVRDVAKLLVEKHIHRVPVVDADQLVGIISSLDVVDLVARDERA